MCFSGSFSLQRNTVIPRSMRRFITLVNIKIILVNSEITLLKIQNYTYKSQNYNCKYQYITCKYQNYRARALGYLLVLRIS